MTVQNPNPAQQRRIATELGGLLVQYQVSFTTFPHQDYHADLLLEAILSKVGDLALISGKSQFLSTVAINRANMRDSDTSDL
jgi:hypothetical protein